MAAGDGLRHLGPGRVEERDEPEQGELSLGLLAHRGSVVAGRQLPAGDREDAEPGGGIELDALEHRGPSCVVERLLAPVGAKDRNGAAEHRLGRPLRVDDEAAGIVVDGGHQPQRRIEPEDLPPVTLAAGDGDVRPEQLRRLEQPDLGRLAARLARLLPVDVRGRAGGERERELGEHGIGRHGCRGIAVRLQVDLSAGGPHADGAHPILGQGAGLVGADHGRRAERLDGAQTLHECAPAGEGADADGESEGDRRQQALGHVGDDEAYREGCRVVQRQPCDEPAEREEGDADRHRDAGDQPRHPAHLALDRARLLPHALGEGRDPPELGVHAGRVDEGTGLTTDARRAAEDEAA